MQRRKCSAEMFWMYKVTGYDVYLSGNGEKNKRDCWKHMIMSHCD